MRFRAGIKDVAGSDIIGAQQIISVIGAGNVLKDIIESDRIPMVRLTRAFRQAQGSRIIMNTHRLNRGGPIDMQGGTFYRVQDKVMQICNDYDKGRCL